jgi:enoyl-CoA hydratase
LRLCGERLSRAFAVSVSQGGCVVELSVSDGIAWLTLNRPGKLNALDWAMVRALAEQLRELRERSDVRVVVTRGAGRAFCAGSDLADLAPLAPAEARVVEEEHAASCALYDALPQPTIAALHGHVLGGGLGLALYHDFRIASTTATLGLPEVELGWTPPWAVGRLVDVVGGASARWLSLACVRVSGAEAKGLGLVHEAVPEPELSERVEELARRLAALPPAGVRETKALLVRMSPLRSAAWDRAAAEAFERCYGTPEAEANVAAFLARRKR